MIMLGVYIIAIMLLFKCDRAHVDILHTMHQSALQPLSLNEIMTKYNVHGYMISGNNTLRQANVDFFITGMGFKDFNTIDVIESVFIPTSEPLDTYVKIGYVHPHYKDKGVHQKVNHGRLGCQLSLVKALDTFLHSSHEIALIFEDDVVIAYDFSFQEAKGLLANMLQIPPRHWHIQYLGFCFACDVPRPTPVPGLPSWVLHGVPPLCTHALVFNRQAARIFVHHWAPLFQPGDVRLADIICETGECLHMWYEMRVKKSDNTIIAFNTTGMRTVRPARPIFGQNRSLSESRTGSKNHPLVPFRSAGLCQKHTAMCRDRYSPVLARKYAVPPQ